MIARNGLLPKWLLSVHRWLGIVVGTVMTLWCLSGFVMLYVDYPRLLPGEQLRGLPTLTSSLGQLPRLPDMALAAARVEMVAGRPVLRLMPEQDQGRAIWQMRATPLNFDLSTGRGLAPLSIEDVRQVGAEFGRNAGVAGAPTAVTPIVVDQWTVQTFRANRPLYRVDYADPPGSTIYVAGLTGEVIQQTTRFERFWGWLGAVPHWLYPTMLRQDPWAWKQVVIWSSLAGCFLTGTGLWIGVLRLRVRPNGALRSPYRGVWWWHHMVGLLFGVLTLTWVASGLFSMNPWGVFDSEAGQAERRRLAGRLHWRDLRGVLAQGLSLPAGTVRVESAPLGGRIALVATQDDGRAIRLNGSGQPAPLTRNDVASALRSGPPLASLTLLREGDSYYYAHKTPVRLPVWRAVLTDPQATRLYIDATSGTLLRTVDEAARAERWLWNAPHSFDFPGLRHGALRSVLLVPLLAAVTLVCGTGTWMGLRKLSRDFRRSRRRFSRLRYGS